ncbi:MAG: hypothetical protein ABIK09_05750 [Pseudomonadota bacterium]
MIKLPHWLLIGAAGRNAGKTALACALIARHHPVAAVKVTVVRPSDHGCPRGGDGCGVCSSVDDTPYWITEETDRASPKDTARLLDAGASPVLWLCTRQAALPEALDALLARLPDGPVIAESNSLRHLVTPGLFLMVRLQGDPTTKPSARAVLPHVDRVVHSDGAVFDLDLDDVVLEDGAWRLL